MCYSRGGAGVRGGRDRGVPPLMGAMARPMMGGGRGGYGGGYGMGGPRYVTINNTFHITLFLHFVHHFSVP